MYYFSALCESSLIGYGGATLFFLTISLFYGRFRRMRDQYLSISNTVAMILGVLVAIGMIWKYAHTIIRDADYTFLRYSILQFLLILLFIGVFPLLFRYDQLKKNVLFTLVMAFLINAACLYKNFLFVIILYARNHFPSSWAYYRSSYLEMICWSLGHFLVIFLAARIKMQRTNPQPS